MRIRLIYLIMGIAILALFVVYFSFPKGVVQEIRQLSGIKKELKIIVGEEEKEVIREMIKVMAHTSVAILPLKKGQLEALGEKLKGKVTTFEFLAVIFSEVSLIEDMRILQKSSIKYKKFNEGLFFRILKDSENDGFYTTVYNFAKHVGVNEQEFMNLLESCLLSAQEGNKSAFQPMMDYLLKI